MTEHFATATSNNHRLQVYLAGRITVHEKDWRRHIIENVATNDFSHPYGQAEHDSPTATWQWAPRAAKWPGVDITGPFFIEGEGHDGMHGDNRHGVGESDYNTMDAGLDPSRRAKVASLCRRAIAGSDLVFCWLDEHALEAYGTLWELGYATALDIPVVIASDRQALPRDLWFACENSHVIFERNPLSGLLAAVSWMAENRT